MVTIAYTRAKKEKKEKLEMEEVSEHATVSSELW